jgi:hypothetical protein
MRIDFFERAYGQLLDSDDATKVLGTAGIHKGVAKVGDIRKACDGHPKGASIRPKNNGSGFYITDIPENTFTS